MPFLLLISLCLILFIGGATWPAMELTKTATMTLKQNLPAIVVNQEGVGDNASNYIFGFVPWDEIEAVIATSRHSRNLDKDFQGIAFVVKGKDVLLRRKPSLTRLWLNMDSEISDRHQIFLPQGRLDVPVEDVVLQINQLRARLNV